MKCKNSFSFAISFILKVPGTQGCFTTGATFTLKALNCACLGSQAGSKCSTYAASLGAEVLSSFRRL